MLGVIFCAGQGGVGTSSEELAEHQPEAKITVWIWFGLLLE